MTGQHEPLWKLSQR